MKTLNRYFLAIALVWSASISLTLAAATLNIGDPAPKLQTGKFVQGDPVTEFAPGTAYIVEFWATWCGPCKASIPHLNETYKKFKDQGLIVIGQDCWEQDESKVAPFVKSMGEQMTYRVALDDKNGNAKGKMAETWLAAADRKGIPAAFLVDTNGKIAWIGHPMELKPTTIAAVLAGTYQAKETAAAEEKAKARIAVLKNDVSTAIKAKEWDKATAGLDELTTLAAEDDALNIYVNMSRFSVLVGQKDFPAAFKVARQLGEATKERALYQNLVSLLLTTDDAIVHPDLDLAQTLSLRAVDLAKDPVEKGLYLDTLARVQFMRGNTNDAVASEQKAVALASGNPSVKEKLQMGLDSYQQGELPAPTWKRTKPASK